MQKTMRELVDAVGLPGASAVCRRWGGREFRVPVKVCDSDPLALALGLELAQKLVAVFGDQRLQLPSEVNALRERRNLEIWRACITEGRSMESVGAEFGLTRQGVQFILGKMREQREGCEA